MDLVVLDDELAICRLAAAEGVPSWAAGDLVATLRSGEELSIVCAAAQVPPGIEASPGWRALRIAGTLDLSLSGVLVALLTPLGAAGILIFAISSFDTDYVLVPADRLEAARGALAIAGLRLR